MMEYVETLEPTVESPLLALRTYVVVEHNGETLSEYPVVDGSMTIGRTSENHVRIKDFNISRMHAQILTVDNHSLIEDMGSRNGTYHKAKLIKRRPMKPGERFRLGTYVVYLEERRIDNELSELMGDWHRGIAPDTTLEVAITIF